VDLSRQNIAYDAGKHVHPMGVCHCRWAGAGICISGEASSILAGGSGWPWKATDRKEAAYEPVPLNAGATSGRGRM
jgi:hypothetical protein